MEAGVATDKVSYSDLVTMIRFLLPSTLSFCHHLIHVIYIAILVYIFICIHQYMHIEIYINENCIQV